MITIPEEFEKQISAFAPLFSKKVFENAKVLLVGTLLVVGRRMVCSALRAVGLSEESRFHKYHWVLSGAKWSPIDIGRTKKYKASSALGFAYAEVSVGRPANKKHICSALAPQIDLAASKGINCY